MRIALRSDEEGGGEVLEIALTWAGDSTDGPDKASVLIDVRGQMISAQE